MKKSWMDRFVIFWWGIKQPYDEHARAEIGHISTVALLLLVISEFLVLMTQAIFNIGWLNVVALVILLIAMVWVSVAIRKAGLTAIETTQANLPHTLHQIKRDAVKYGISFGLIVASMMVLIDATEGDSVKWVFALAMGAVGGIFFGLGTYQNEKKQMRVLPDDD